MPTNTTTSNGDTKQITQNPNSVRRIWLDGFILIVLVIPIVVFEYAVEPFRRGFFCDDETIRYPFKDNTVTVTALALLLGLLPLLVLIISEYARQYYRGEIGHTGHIFGFTIAIWIKNCFTQFIYFMFGLLLMFNAIEVGKFTIGRPRPYFMAVCQPQLSDGTNCYDLVNQHRYVENYFCLGTGYTIQDVRQSRLSFPSGHACLAFYTFVYISLYLQKRLHWRRSDLTRHFIQFSFLMLAWFIALSRIMDNWHHWSDVLAGSLIGVLGAFINAYLVSKFFKTSYKDFGTLRLTGLTRQDTSATLNEVLATTPPPYTTKQQAANTFSNDCTNL